jgi:hypothetical protein
MDSNPQVHNAYSISVVEIKMNGLDLMKTKGYTRSNLGHWCQNRWSGAAYGVGAGCGSPAHARPRCSSAPNVMGPSLNRREGHGDPHLGLKLARESAVRARDGEVASPYLSGDDGSLWWPPGSKTQSNSFVAGSSPSSYAPIMARKSTLLFLDLRLKIWANPGLFIGDFDMDS